MISTWLHGWPGPRPDWVSQNEPTDLNELSYGCSLYFLYYLKSQLGFSVEDIVRKGGATLEDTYFNLTGEHGGFAAMNALLEQYLPYANTSYMFTNGRNDLFPLLDVATRQLFLSAHTSAHGRSRVIKRGEAQRRLLGCPTGTYAYSLIQSAPTTTCVATPYGFGQPLYSWTINGSSVSGTGQLDLSLEVSDPDPNAPPPGNAVTPVKIDFQVVATGMQSSLTLTIPAMAGVVDLVVEVSAAELVYEPQASTTLSRFVTVANETVVWSPDYRKDLAKCLKHFMAELHALAPPYDWLSWDLATLLTLPDPVPDELLAALRLTRRLSAMTEQLERHAPARIREAVEACLVERGLAGLSGTREKTTPRREN